MADKKADALADSQKQSEADTKAHYERVNSSQPTPTQEENDLAKLGFDSLKDLDAKEDDGSPSEEESRAAAAKAAAAKK